MNNKTKQEQKKEEEEEEEGEINLDHYFLSTCNMPGTPLLHLRWPRLQGFQRLHQPQAVQQPVQLQRYLGLQRTTHPLFHPGLLGAYPPERGAPLFSAPSIP